MPHIRAEVAAAEASYKAKRDREKLSAEAEIADKRVDYDDPSLELDERRRRFYQSASKHSPEYRKESQRFREFLDKEDEAAKKNGEGKVWSRVSPKLSDDVL